MFRVATAACAVILSATCVLAGDLADGIVFYSVDLGASFSRYEMSAGDLDWSLSLAANLGYEGKVVHFVRTTLVLHVDDVVEEGDVYQAVEWPDQFYVVPGDAMLKIGTRCPTSPGVGGLSMHAPKSRNFIVCLNCHGGGVPFLSGSRVKKRKVTWSGSAWTRF